MAKTVKRESKSKTSAKKNVVTNEVIVNENVVSPENEDPVLVNDKNEIIYNPQEELDEILDNIKSKIPTDFIEDDVKEGIEFIKNNASIPTDLGSDVDKNVDFVEKQINELSKIKEKLTKSIKNDSAFNFTTYWNGTSNKW